MLPNLVAIRLEKSANQILKHSLAVFSQYFDK
mgnify:CR=1 FL=1